MGSFHTKIAAEGGVTIYRRVSEAVIEVSVDDVGDAVAYIIVDHWTRKAGCGSTEEQARQNLRRARGLHEPVPVSAGPHRQPATGNETSDASRVE